MAVTGMNQNLMESGGHIQSGHVWILADGI